MTALIGVESAVLLVLSVLVAGLLRSHATILRRLHELDTGRSQGGADFRVMPGLAEPVPLDAPFLPARDIEGRSLDDDAIVIRTGHVEHGTVLAFLSSSCSTCETFWEEFASPGLLLPADVRLVVVTKGLAEESPFALAQLRPRGIDVVMSSQAWVDYQVPGSPYVVAIDGPSGRTIGEGTGMSWNQVARLLAESTGDAGYVADTGFRQHKPESDAEREARVDRELISAGILPGDPSLYPATSGDASGVRQGRS
jgi:hypothetical protein